MKGDNNVSFMNDTVQSPVLIKNVNWKAVSKFEDIQVIKEHIIYISQGSLNNQPWQAWKSVHFRK